MIDRTHLFFCFLLTATTLSIGCNQSPEISASKQSVITSTNPVSQQVSSIPKNNTNKNKAAQNLNVNVKQNKTQNHILLEAVPNNNLEGVKSALAKGADVNATNPADITALMLAAFNGNLDIFNTLLDADADINRLSGEGETALMMASLNGHLEIAKILIEKGADITIQDAGDAGGTALIKAAAGGHIEVVRLLLANGADASTKNLYGDTALTLTQKNGYPQIVELLKKAE